MNSLPDQSVRFSADIRQVLLDGGLELMGPLEAGQVFACLEDPSLPDSAALAAVSVALESHFGPRESKGVALRLGRTAFQVGLRRWGQAAGLTAPEFRLQSSPRKVRAFLRLLGDQLASRFGSVASLEEDDRCWYWRVESCPACQGRAAAVPDCHLLTGLLMEALSWAGGGRYFCVGESECQAAGAPACVFRIDKKALD